jgi:biopolymer transport protein TolR
MSMIGSEGKKDLNFELNLLPIFDILSVCICFLLMTVVWIEVAGLKSSQSVGAASGAAEKKPTLFVRANNSGDLEIEVKNSKQNSKFTVSTVRGEMNWDQLDKVLSQVRVSDPLLITGIIVPSEKFEYGNLIHVMDEVKKSGIRDMGISPM